MPRSPNLARNFLKNTKTQPMQKANKQTAAVALFFLIGIPLLVWLVDSVGEWMAK